MHHVQEAEAVIMRAAQGMIVCTFGIGLFALHAMTGPHALPSTWQDAPAFAVQLAGLGLLAAILWQMESARPGLLVLALEAQGDGRKALFALYIALAVIVAFVTHEGIVRLVDMFGRGYQPHWLVPWALALLIEAMTGPMRLAVTMRRRREAESAPADPMAALRELGALSTEEIRARGPEFVAQLAAVVPGLNTKLQHARKAVPV